MSKKTSAFFLVLITGFIIFAAHPVSAQTSAVQSQLDMIAQLTKQIQDLQNQILALQQKAQEINTQRQTQVASLINTLRQGSSGDDVKVLQALLAADPSIYPEGIISGTYGPLTAKAVRKFQSMHGIEQVGIVGPRTLEKLNELLKENPIALEHASTSTTNTTTTVGGHGRGRDDENEHRPCAIVPPGHLIARGWLKKNDKPIVPTCQTLPPGIDKKHEDDNENENENEHGGNATSTPDVIAPVISSINAANITTTGATINWATNENSNSKVYYSATSPVSLTSSTIISDATLLTSHSLNLSGLTPSTLYYYVVESKDASGNKATSGQSSFTTASPDTTTPIISAVATSNISSTSVTVTWTTNEAATSRVYYNTISPLNFTTALVADVAGLVASHSVGITGLNATTTYYFAVESKDASNNTATSSQSSFTTTP